jgi:hypothetical protein
MTGPRKSTVGDVKKALSIVTGIDPAHIGHFVIAMDTDAGVILKFCCDDRRHAAVMFASAARLVVTVRGVPLHPDGPVPGMPEDN